MLTERKRHILKFIVSDYIKSAMPVASSVVAKSAGLTVSPATIRNEMVALEEDGYIHRPHVSSGGIPSDRGYREFVESLDADARLARLDAIRVQRTLSGSPEDLDEWAETAARILASLLDTVAFATPLQSSSPSIKGIQLLELQEMLIMLVVVMQEAVVYRQLINTDESIKQSELETVRNRVNQQIAGKSLAALRDGPVRLDDELDKKVVDSTIDVVTRHEAERSRSRKLQGLSRLFKQPEFEGDVEHAQMAVAAIESDDVFEELASTAVQSSGAITIIGEENHHSSLQKFSVIVFDYGIDDEASGAVGILAPTRLSYDRAIPLVSYTGTSLNQMARRVYGVA